MIAQNGEEAVRTLRTEFYHAIEHLRNLGAIVHIVTQDNDARLWKIGIHPAEQFFKQVKMTVNIGDGK